MYTLQDQEHAAQSQVLLDAKRKLRAAFLGAILAAICLGLAFASGVVIATNHPLDKDGGYAALLVLWVCVTVILASFATSCWSEYSERRKNPRHFELLYLRYYPDISD